MSSAAPPVFAERWNMYVVTQNPSDYPGRFVVRIWDILPGQAVAHRSPYAIKESLEGARATIPAGRVRIDRDPSDDPVIVESWL